MKKTYLSLFLSLALVFSFLGASSAEAATTGFPDGCSSTYDYSATTGRPCNGTSTATRNPTPNSFFPDGCASNLGFSSTKGNPCNGTSTATTNPMPGCTSALGYSSTSSQPCSGGPIAINFLGGCTSVYGYSAITGEACNGTDTAVFINGGTTTTPGLPTTGDGGNASGNILTLLASGLVVLMGLGYIVKQSRANANS